MESSEIEAAGVQRSCQSYSSCYLQCLGRCLAQCVFISIFLAVLGLHCCAGFSLVEASRGYSRAAVHGLPTAVTSLVELRLSGACAQ